MSLGIRFIYPDGDHVNYINLIKAVFNGTQEEYFQSFIFWKRRTIILGF